MRRPIIQAGMGVNISTPFLARVCSSHPSKQVLGTVSGVAANVLLARILQQGDPGRHYRRALEHFPFPGVTDRIIERYFVEGGIPAGQEFKSVPIFSLKPGRDLAMLTVVASFAFVWLGKEGHDNPISINYLEKIQLPRLYEIYGAMLAGVDFITMGAGITLQIPSVLDAFANGESASYRIQVEGGDGTEVTSFDPRELFGPQIPELKRPGFLPIVSTDVLASLMVKRLPPGSIQGFVIEKPTAGGHNAPPRGKYPFNEKGEPVYGPRDEVNFETLTELGIPFWIGGSFASPENLARALSLGAEGIQAGSIFALCEDSGMESSYRKEIRRLGYLNELNVRTDPRASPTGFPIKVVQLAGTLSSDDINESRDRLCNLGFLRAQYRKPDGTIGLRCPAEPIKDFIDKGGKLEDTKGVRCICNALVSAAALGDPDEPPIFTLGDDVSFLRDLMKDASSSYSAHQSIAHLLGSPT